MLHTIGYIFIDNNGITFDDMTAIHLSRLQPNIITVPAGGLALISPNQTTMSFLDLVLTQLKDSASKVILAIIAALEQLTFSFVSMVIINFYRL